MSKAPSGASARPQAPPAMLIIREQGTGRRINASVTRIKRMVHSLFENEATVAAFEDLPREDGLRMYNLNGKIRRVNPVTGLVKAKETRDKHLDHLAHVIDYALTDGAFKDVACPTCKLPEAPLDFVRAVADFNPPAMQCQTCKGRGAVRRQKTDKKSKESFRLISYLKRVFQDVIDCSKIRAGSSDSDDAYLRLEKKNSNLFKFGHENQTSLEGDDAVAGVRQGIIDTAHRFDPFKQKNGRYTCATFNTVAYKWCFRNSRARSNGQKRPGIYAPSIEGMGRDEEGNGAAALVTDFGGSVKSIGGRLNTKGRNRAMTDDCRLCGDRSVIDEETWQPTGLCESCSKLPEKLRKKKDKVLSDPGSLGSSGPGEDLLLDLRLQIERLPERQRLVIMGELQGLNSTQISRSTGMAPATIRTLRENAFINLRYDLQSYGDIVETLCD